MAKAEWGKKHTCPKCDTRFYDLGKKGPAVCIECEHSWVPEPILKAKQSYVAAPKPAVQEAAKKPADDAGEDAKDKASEPQDADAAKIKGLEVEVEDDADEKEAGVAGDISLDDDKADMSEVVDTKLEKGGSE